MNISDEWGRVAGLSCDEGALAAVWIAYNKPEDTAHLYDAALFSDMPLDRTAEALNARGKSIAIAWPKTARTIAERLLHEGGCNMAPEVEAIDDSESVAALAFRDLAARLRSNRLVINPSVKEWTREYEQWQRIETPTATTPLLVATRYALERLYFARPRSRGPKQPIARHVPIV